MEQIAGSVAYRCNDICILGKYIPALHIDLNSNLWSMNEGGSGTTPGGSTGGDGNGEGGNGSGSSSGLTCQWYYATSQTGEGTAIQGADTFTYTLTDTDISYNGRYYYCVVSDGVNEVASERAKLTVLQDGDPSSGNEQGGDDNPKLTVSTPEDQAVKTGESAVFAVNTSGGSSSDLTCQWYYATSQMGEGTLIEGANAFIYTLASTNTSYNGRYYYCTVTDGSNSVTSGRAKLTIYSPPTVSNPTRTPSTSTLTEGQSVTFSVKVSGGNPANYTYQWYYYTLFDLKNHIKIEGATSPTYKIAKTVAYGTSVYNLNTHYFYCVVSNGVYNVKPERSVSLDVKAPVKRKTQKITASSFKMTYGSYKYMKAKTSGDGNLTYKGSNSKVARVSTYGWIDAKNYGKATITIKASQTTAYKAATKKITVTVVPQTVALTKATSPTHKNLSLKWKKDKTVMGYEVNLSLKKNFKSQTIKREYKASKTSTVIANVPVKTYYVRIRSYKKVGKSKYYGNWSKTKSVKIK